MIIKKDEIPQGKGKYVPGEIGQPFGANVYHDASGSFEVFSSCCPHRACNVEWGEEKDRWVCPCHGSEFTPHGKVLNGPAMDNLKKIPFKDEGDALNVEF